MHIWYSSHNYLKSTILGSTTCFFTLAFRKTPMRIDAQVAGGASYFLASTRSSAFLICRNLGSVTMVPCHSIASKGLFCYICIAEELVARLVIGCNSYSVSVWLVVAKNTASVASWCAVFKIISVQQTILNNYKKDKLY